MYRHINQQILKPPELETTFKLRQDTLDARGDEYKESPPHILTSWWDTLVARDDTQYPVVPSRLGTMISSEH